jgi:hypothetical protein
MRTAARILRTVMVPLWQYVTNNDSPIETRIVTP